MRVLIRTGLVLAAVAALAACGTATAPVPDPLSTAMPPGPPPGSRAEATALAGLLLSGLDLPPGALRLAGEPLPPSLSQPAYGCAGCTAHVDVHQLFAAAQVVVTVVPTASGGSMLRADGQVTWYPPRTFAEYIDPDYYHVLTITATSYGRGVHTVHAIVTSRAVIARIAEALDRSPARPPGIVSCPDDQVSYQLAFLVSAHRRPDVVVYAVPSSCPATAITVGGQSQPALADRGAMATPAGQALHSTSRP